MTRVLPAVGAAFQLAYRTGEDELVHGDVDDRAVRAAEAEGEVGVGGRLLAGYERAVVWIDGGADLVVHFVDEVLWESSQGGARIQEHRHGEGGGAQVVSATRADRRH